MIGYHLNRGADQVAEFIGVEQVHRLFYRPDLVQAKFNGDEQQIRQAIAAIGDMRDIIILLRGNTHDDVQSNLQNKHASPSL